MCQAFAKSNKMSMVTKCHIGVRFTTVGYNFRRRWHYHLRGRCIQACTNEHALDHGPQTRISSWDAVANARLASVYALSAWGCLNLLCLATQ